MIIDRLGHVVAEFVLECLDEVHSGSGEIGVLSQRNARSEDLAVEFDTFTRSVDTVWGNGEGQLRPVLTGSSLKGAFRAAAPPNVSDLLFGSVSPGEEETGTGGLLVPYSALLIPRSVPFNPELPRPGNEETETYIRIGNAASRRTQAVAKQFLYSQEVVPKGSRFRGRLALRAPSRLRANPVEDDQLTVIVGELLSNLCAKSGFSLGAGRGFMGRVRLTDSVLRFHGSVLYKFTKPSKNNQPPKVSLRRRDVEIEVRSQPAASKQATHLSVHVPGPMLIANPAWIDEGRNKNTSRNLGREPSTQSAPPPSSLARAVRQALRIESHKLELRQAFLAGGQAWEDAQERLDDLATKGEEEFQHVVRKADEVAKLTRTQRLFGVAGWGGVVRLHSVASRARQSFRIPVVAIESLTQAPLGDRLAFREGPADLDMEFSLELAENRLRMVASVQADDDIAHLQNVLARFYRRGIRLGHAKGVGLGAGQLTFEPAALEITAPTQEIEPAGSDHG